MKRKIIGGMAVLIIATVAMFNVNIGSKSSKLSDISLTNVEALAEGDEAGGSSGTFTCYSRFNNCWFWDCSTIYRCGNPCTTESADDWGDIGQCSNNT